MGEKINAYRALVKKPEINRLLVRPGHISETFLKRIFKEQDRRVWTGFICIWRFWIIAGHEVVKIH
jgi:hypothetical protein